MICPLCHNKGYIKRLRDASPPYFADDELERGDCPECVAPVVEIVANAAAIGVVREKTCPKRGHVLTRPIGSLWCYNGSSWECGRPALWMCASCLGHAWCQSCYEKLP